MDLVVEEMRSRQVHDNMLATLRPTSLKTKSPLEKQAHDVLTPFAFKTFQEELERASQYLIEHSDGNQFIIRYFEQGNHKFHSVFWDGDTALCSCKTFEFWGILCRHIFRALIHKDCFMLSHVYLPRRWCLESLRNDNVAQNIPMNESPLDPAPPMSDKSPDQKKRNFMSAKIKNKRSSKEQPAFEEWEGIGE
ncbi:protein FAR1-RELATED SEQUENCE 11-like [Rutidosis leptorrhynchoides]|uniref:protein FAR1-RELATED SEQUENCE 11-like n=1 Tax=Rutidosis leptorrhynchoides TaxID=125765 RepID=UPI003A98D9C4